MYIYDIDIDWELNIDWPTAPHSVVDLLII